ERSTHIDRRLSFGFQRLSIVDVNGGQQPIWNEDRSIFVAANGEIYNHMEIRRSLEGRHTFRTRSDTEAILHLYEERGPEAVKELIGKFAVVIWDSRKEELFLARDRLGIKPLYYARTDRSLFFGSELKALLAHPDCPRDLEWQDFGGMPRDHATYVRGID